MYPERDGNPFLSASYRRALRAKEVEMIPFTGRTASVFAKVRAVHRVKPPDTIHLASAVSGRADVFVTEDVHLLRLSLTGIGQIANLNAALALL